MLEQIRNIIARLTMTTTPSLEELEASLARARQQHETARQSHARARTQYVADLTTDDGTKLAKLRTRLRDAERDLEETAERVAALEALGERVAAEAEAAELARRWRGAQANGGEFVFAVEHLDRVEQEYLEALEAARVAGAKFDDSLPVRPATTEGLSLVYRGDVLIRRARLQLYAHSGGRFTTPGVSMSPAELANGPPLGTYARQAVERAMRPPTPPSTTQEVAP